MPHPTLTRAASTEDYGSKRHPEGGYVLKIIAAVDHEEGGYVEVSYEIAEGERAGYYEWSESFRRYYESNYPGATQFEKFLTAVEKSNAGFNFDEWARTWDVSALEGLLVGAVFKKRLYTTEQGNDREAPKLAYTCAADDIRNGKYTVPEPEDNRTVIATDDGVPF